MENYSFQNNNQTDTFGENTPTSYSFSMARCACSPGFMRSQTDFTQASRYLPDTQIQFSRSDFGMNAYFGRINNQFLQPQYNSPDGMLRFHQYDPNWRPTQYRTPPMMSFPDIHRAPNFRVNMDGYQQRRSYWDLYWSAYFANQYQHQRYEPRHNQVPAQRREEYFQRGDNQTHPERTPHRRSDEPYEPSASPDRPNQREPNDYDRYTRRESDNGRNIVQVRPGESIQSAIDRAPAGSIIRVMPGTYRERIRINKDNITLQGERGAVLDYNGVSISGGAIQISDRQNVRIEGFEIRNIRGGSTPTAIRVDGASKNISIVNNDIHHVESSSNAHAIGVFGTKSTAIQNVVIAGNRVHDLKLGQSEAVVLNGNVDGFRILQNKIYNTDNIAIDIIGGEGVGRAGTDRARNGIIAGNEITNVDSKRNPTYRSACAAGIYVDGGSDIVIEDNVVKNANYGIELASERRGWRTERIQVRRNRLESNNLAGISLGGGGASNGGVNEVVIENNTFQGNARGIWRQNNVGRVQERNNQGI